MKPRHNGPFGAIVDWGRAGLESLTNPRLRFVFAVTVLLVLFDVVVTITGGLSPSLKVAIFVFTVLAIVTTLVWALSVTKSSRQRMPLALILLVLLIAALLMRPPFEVFSRAVGEIAGRTSPSPIASPNRSTPVLGTSDVPSLWAKASPEAVAKVGITIGTLQPCRSLTIKGPVLKSTFVQAFVPRSGSELYNEAAQFEPGGAAGYLTELDASLAQCPLRDLLKSFA